MASMVQEEWLTLNRTMSDRKKPEAVHTAARSRGELGKVRALAGDAMVEARGS